MDTITSAPSFTVSLRGYDREEVDEYLDSLAEALAQVDDAEEHSRRLQAHVARCNARIRELEDRIKTDTPRTATAIGERVGLLLRAAEEAAEEITTRAEGDAARTIAAAEAHLAEANEVMSHATARAEAEAGQIQAAARREAAEIVAEAEGRAGARTRQIEQWAEQVISHTRAEEARMLAEHRTAQAAAQAELAGMAEQRKTAAATLVALREALGQAVGIVEVPLPVEEPPVDHAVETEVSVAANGGGDADGDEEIGTPPRDAQFEAKLDAWVTGQAHEE